MLDEVRDRACRRAATADSLAVLDRGSAVPYRTADPAHALAAPVELRHLLPQGGLRRGTSVAAVGSTSLLLSLLGAAQQAGAWCAVLGPSRLNAVAAPEFAIDLAKLAFVPNLGPKWMDVAAALIDGLDLVVLAVPGLVSADVAGRLIARARRRGCVLVPVGPPGLWPGVDVVLEVTGHRWHGLGVGRGRIRGHDVRVEVAGRRARPSSAVWVPMPPPSLVEVAGPQPGAVPNLGLPVDWPATGRPQLTVVPVPAAPAAVRAGAAEDPWAAHLITEEEFAARRSRSA
ncbi:hypothetical protein AB0M46_05515 [Dactylosporangium sp. NPDC051485]|uniref:hypothetical protein n=1 Tax=Dactylosporangium sp. NPDC051485 TaxID=3154846 RepID=UPI0034345B84